jgi:hypothetical protein
MNDDGSSLKPWISLSGDDDGKHYILYPKNEDKNDWNYDLQMIIDTGYTLFHRGAEIVRHSH